MRRALLAACAVMLVAMTAVAAASADTTVTSYQRLRIQIDPSQSGCNPSAGSSAGWITGTDSPLDSNSRFLAINVGTPTGCVILYSNASFNKVISSANQKNLSYEFNTSSVTGAGQFYLAAQFGNGDIAYLDPYYCQHPIASQPSWSRSDFTGFKTDCAFNVNGSNTSGGFEDTACTIPAVPGDTERWFCADGTNSAWANYVAANPDTTVVHRYMVFSGAGSYHLDRISLGAGKMYTRGSSVAKSCTTESSC
jgi:hypothetical protein